MGRVLRLINGVARHVDETAVTIIYDEVYDVPSTITTGSAVTLPASKTYDSAELEVYLNGQRLTYLLDYNYVGSSPRTQVSFTFDLLGTDVIRFRIDRPA